MNGLTLADAGTVLSGLAFIKSRLDLVALDVVGWMPPDAERHHDTVEMLLRAFRVATDLEGLLVERTGHVALSLPGDLERVTGRVELARSMREPG